MPPRPGAVIDCGKRLGAIPVAALNAALSRLDLGPVAAVELIPHGLFGQNVRLHTPQGVFVLRGCPHTPSQLHGEAFFARAAHPHAPVPWPYRICDDATDLGWTFAVMPCLPGRQLHQEIGLDTMAAGEVLDLARALGESLADLHETPMPCWGAYEPAARGIKPAGLPPAAWLRTRMRRDIDWTLAAPGNRLPPADLEWIEWWPSGGGARD